MNTYSTRYEALMREIVVPIEATRGVIDAHAEYDINKIVTETIASYEVDDRRTFVAFVEDDDAFWAIVERNRYKN